MSCSVTVKQYVIKYKGNRLTLLATLLACAMSSLILRMFVVTLLTGFFPSTTFSLSSNSGTRTFSFSTAGKNQEWEKNVKHAQNKIKIRKNEITMLKSPVILCCHFQTKTVLNEDLSPASPAETTACSYAAEEYSSFLMLRAHCCTLLSMGVMVSRTSAERLRVSSATSKEKFRRCGVLSINCWRLMRNSR